ncbi:hypothetical protein Pfo_014385 [Paulownia fortunei]|nr:hypothetical protein Pfo_014385 [Paulownia fortunei]
MSVVKMWFVLALLLVTIYSQKSDGLLEEWCIADEQTPDSELQVGLDWACGRGGANCSKIQVGQACFWPNTVSAHASYAFNNYYQKFKHRGGSCYFNSAAITTDLDPSKQLL